jgi:hypothetical protein
MDDARLGLSQRDALLRRLRASQSRESEQVMKNKDGRMMPETVYEAEHLLKELHKASRFCTGPESSARHGQRIREVERERDRLKK